MPSKKFHWQEIPKVHWQFAREMRRDPTTAERTLWQALRSAQFGVTFRRQHPIGPFISDFYAPEIGLVIEVDGETHDQPGAAEYDLARNDFLRSRGLSILRFTDADVLAGGTDVMTKIQQAIARKKKHAGSDPPLPPRKRRGN